MRHPIAITVSVLASAAPLATVATAEPIANVSAVRGVSGSGLSSGAPGNDFSLDFRPNVPGAAVPYDALQISLIFDGLATQFTTLNVQLDSSPEVFSFLPYPGNQRQVAYTLYDPEFNPTPGAGYPTTPVFVLMPQAWRDEFTDGILAGRLWVTNPSGGSGAYLFSVSSAFAVPESAVPEPGAAVAVLSTTSLFSLRRRQRAARQ